LSQTSSQSIAPNSADDHAEKLREILTRLRANPILAHDLIFQKRHPNKTPDFHRQMILDFWSDEEFVGTEAFREGAKSTVAEEGLALMALFAVEPFFLIIGANYERACDRLTAIKHEIETNEYIQELFGDQRGPVWNEGEIILKNGTKIMALGARMKFRGVKYKDSRPKFVLVDDLEDEENINTEEKREKLAKWVSRVVWPACSFARKRIVGTPLHPNSWLENMRKNARWRFSVYPIVVPAVVESEKWERSQWPDRYSLDWIRNKMEQMTREGDLQGFVQEYLCRSEDPSLKPFHDRHIVPATALPPNLPSIVICDPARTVGMKSARTGYAVVSWMGSTLNVRHAFGSYDMPAKIIDTLFNLDTAFNPTWIVVEKDGLEQFLMQPLRQEQVKRGVILPIKPINAPREIDKDGFIRGLQPFFEAGEIRMCGDFTDLKAEILNFPSGLKDILNALAYAPRLRAGKPVYDDFSYMHIAPEPLRPNGATAPYLIINCEPQYTVGILVQYVNRALRVFGDWVREGSPDDALEAILPDARQAADGKQFKFFAPVEQFDQYNNFGLPRAQRRLKIPEITHGPNGYASLGALTPSLRERAQVQPAFMVSPGSRWTINGLAQGYAYKLDKTGVLSQEPEPGYYTTAIRGLESFAKWLTVRVSDTAGEQSQVNWAYTPDGRRYMSARVQGGVNDGRDYKRSL